MSDIPHFERAVEHFRQFLAKCGHSDEMFWVFRDDIWQLSPSDGRVKYPPAAENAALAKKVFEEGRERGLVEIRTVVTTGQKVAATVWFPKYPNQEVQDWDCGMKLTISEPLRRASTIGRLRWRLFRFLPSYRRYQEAAIFIGTSHITIALTGARAASFLCLHQCRCPRPVTRGVRCL